MSYRFGRGTAAACALVVVLAGAACVPLAGPASPTGAAAEPGASAPGRASFVGGEVVVAAPAGYCIDTAASHDDGDGAVVVIGKCNGTSAAEPALIAISIGGPGSSAVLQSGAQALSDYFLTPAGRAALARDGQASSVRVQQTALSEGALVLRVSDRAVGDYWRAVLGLRGRLVTLSVIAPEGATLSADAGRRILDRTMAALRRANPASPG